MFRKTVGKKCGEASCDQFGVAVDAGQTLCETCGQELQADVVTNKAAIAIASLVAIGLVTAGGYAAVLGLKAWAIRKATATAEAALGEVLTMAAAGAPEMIEKAMELINQSEGTLPTDIVDRLRTEVESTRGVVEETLAAQKEYADIMRELYSDFDISPDEKKLLDAERERLSLSGDWASRPQENIQKSMDALREGMEAGQRGDNRTAVDAFEVAAAADSGNAYVFANLCGGYLGLDDLRNAADACDTALKIDANNWLAHYNRGALLALQGDSKASLDSVGRTVRLVKGQPELEPQVLASLRQDEMFLSLHDQPTWRVLVAEH